MVQYFTFARLADWGVFDVILPFILIFTIVYAILHKTKILGDKARNFNMVISLVMGLSVVVPHVLYGNTDPGSPYLNVSFWGGDPMIDIVKVINNALPNVSVILVAVLMLLLIFGIWGTKIRLGENSLSGLIALFAFTAVTWIFGAAAGWWRVPQWWWAQALMDPDTQALVITILVFAIVIWFITKENEEKDKDSWGKFFSDIFDKEK